MYTNRCIAQPWVRFRYFDSMFGFLEIGTCYHELLASSIDGSLYDVFEIIFVTLSAVIFTTVYRIREVDTDLGQVRRRMWRESEMRTNIDVLELRGFRRQLDGFGGFLICKGGTV